MHYQFEKIRARRRAEGKEPGLIDSGFTLIELLIVIVVLGILAAVVIFALSGVTGQSAQSACNADAKSVEVAAEAYHTQNAAWPTQAQLVPNYVRTWPSNAQHYTITLGGGATPDGTVIVAPTGGTAAQTVNYDSQAAAAGGNPATGCYAVQ
jgi:general secretion pathway protein G